MSGQLKVSIGQHSDKGRKPINQDFYGVCVPKEPLLSAKGIAIALADGISSSQVSEIASQAAVRGFLEDYYCTSEAWSVRNSAQRVLSAINSWLHAQTQSQYRFDKDRGYICTFSAAIIKSATIHIFHVGDARVYRVVGSGLEQLTADHRVYISSEQNYLARALGFMPSLEIDYLALQIDIADTFMLATDGVYEHITPAAVTQIVAAHQSDLDRAAQLIIEQAIANGSDDNVTVQIVRIDELASRGAGEMVQQLAQLPFPPAFSPRMDFDGYKILRELHITHRSHLYLAQDNDTQALVVIKIPSIDLREQETYIENFLMEEWIARRINNTHVVKAVEPTRKRHYLYTVTEFVDGQTLAQWMIDNPRPQLETVRGIVEQIAKGLRAFHRAEMLHQDLRPENIMLDIGGTIKIIDFGSVSVAGVRELDSSVEQLAVRGAIQYAAPEYFLGEFGSAQSDIFSLGVITYQMLTGKLPYGAELARSQTRSAQDKLVYESVRTRDRGIPVWVDEVLRKAVHPLPSKRYENLSEFIYDLRHPRQEYLNRTRLPLIERNPVLFWKSLSIGLALAVVILLSCLV